MRELQEMLLKNLDSSIRRLRPFQTLFDQQPTLTGFLPAIRFIQNSSTYLPRELLAFLNSTELGECSGFSHALSGLSGPSRELMPPSYSHPTSTWPTLTSGPS